MDLPALAAYNEAVAAARQSPDDDTALAAHLESALIAVVEAAERCVPKPATPEAAGEHVGAVSRATRRLGSREEEARAVDGTVKTMTAAKKWITEHGSAFRNLRLEPIAAAGSQDLESAAPGEQCRPRRHHVGRYRDAAPGELGRVGRRQAHQSAVGDEPG